jgi:hypothetical protein
MALHLGELVAGLRADDAPFTRALSRAELAMRGLTRGVDGQLRDMRGRFVSQSSGMGRSLSDGIGRGARGAVLAIGKIAPALAGLGAGLPVVAAAATALGGLAAGAAAAGLAYKAFSLAAGPQMESVTEVSKLAEEAQKAVAAGAEDAAEKQKAYKDAMSQLPPATQQTAKAFIGLKKDYKGWSDEMSGTTMPIFTKGIEILRDLLPMLTPFVKAAASAISGFLDEVAVGVKSAGFKEWAADMASAAGPALRNFLSVIKNLAIGFGGLLQAFLPVSDGMTGGLVQMSQAFADWGSSLKGSEGFATFLELAQEGGTTLGQLALAVGNLLVALAPLIGVTTQVALALARIINALPPEVLSVLATTIAAVVIGMKAWAIGARVVATANALMASSSLAAIRGWVRMMAVGVAAYVRIAAAAVASAARTAAAWAGAALRSMATFAVQMIRTALVAVGQFALMAARAIAWAAVMAAQWLIAMGPIGWITIAVIALVALIIAKWDLVKQWTLAAWSYVSSAISTAIQAILTAIGFLASIPGRIAGYFGAAKTAAISRMTALVSWLRGVPGKAGAALAGLVGSLRNAAVNGFNAFRSAASSRAASFISWVRGMPKRIASAIGSLSGLLVSKGRDVIRGLWNGIKAMGSWLKNQLINFAKSMIPGPIASALGISSPSRLMADQVGRWIPAGIAQGVTRHAGVLDSAMSNLVSTPTPSASMAMAAGVTGVGGGSAGGQTPRAVTLRSDGSAFSDLVIGTIRDAVGDRGGNVQFVLGR